MEPHRTNDSRELNEYETEAYKAIGSCKNRLRPLQVMREMKAVIDKLLLFSLLCLTRVTRERVSSLSDFKGLFHHGREVMKARI